MYCGTSVSPSRNIAPDPKAETKEQVLAAYDAELQSRADASAEADRAWQKNLVNPASTVVRRRRRTGAAGTVSATSRCVENIASRPGKPAHQCPNKAKPGTNRCGRHPATAPAVDWEAPPAGLTNVRSLLP